MRKEEGKNAQSRTDLEKEAIKAVVTTIVEWVRKENFESETE